MTQTAEYTEQRDLTRLCLSWWHRLVATDGRDSHSAFPRAYAAILKRCNSLDEILMTAPFQELWLSLPESKRTPNRMMLSALLVSALANVKTNSEKELAKAMAEPAQADGSMPRVSQLRFQQLIKSRTHEEFSRRLRRIVKQLDNTVSVASLVNDVENWFWQSRHPQKPVKPENRQTLIWAMEYYQALPKKKD